MIEEDVSLPGGRRGFRVWVMGTRESPRIERLSSDRVTGSTDWCRVQKI
jgi:hypothetical protein